MKSDVGARIFKPTKTAMQSGRANTKEWVLQFEPKAAKRSDPLMGWSSSPDTEEQVHLRFRTLDEAVAYAKKQGLAYAIEPPQAAKLRAKSYAENFRSDRVV